MNAQLLNCLVRKHADLRSDHHVHRTQEGSLQIWDSLASQAIGEVWAQ